MESPQKPTPVVGFSFYAVHGMFPPAGIYPAFGIHQRPGYYNPSPCIFDPELSV
jgi:hypothetical protein